MPINPSIPLGVEQAPLIQTPEQRLSSQTAQLELQERQRDVRDRMQLRAILQKYGGDWEKAQGEISALNPTLGLSVRKSLQDAQTQTLEFQSAKLRHHAELAGLMGRLAGSVDGQEGLDTLRMTIQAESPQDAARIPAIWDPASTPQFIEGLKRGAMTAEQQFQADEKRLKDKRDEAALERQRVRDFAIEQGKQAVETRRLAEDAQKAKPVLGSEADYLTRYANDRGVPVENLTADDLVKARGEYGKEYAPTKAPAVGSFEDYLLRTYGEKPTPAQILTARKDYGQADDRVRVTVGGDEVQNIKEAISGMKEGTLPPVMPGRASKDYIAILAEARRQHFDLAGAATDWAATQKHIATLNNAQQTRLNQSINQLPELLDSIDVLADKWKAGRFPLLNRANLALAKGGAFGKDAASVANQLDAQIADVTADLGNVYMGGNSPTDHALGLAAKSLSSDWDARVLHDMTALARQNVKIRQNSIRNTGVQGASEGNPYAPKPTTDAPKGDPLGLFTTKK